MRQNEPPLFWVYFFEKMLPTGEMLKMLKFKGPTHKNVLKTGEMLKMLKRLKVFWVLTPPPFWILFFRKNASHWGNVKNVKNLKGLLTKKVLKTGEMLKMLKMLKVFWVLAPPLPSIFFGGRSRPRKLLTFLTFPQF